MVRLRSLIECRLHVVVISPVTERGDLILSRRIFLLNDECNVIMVWNVMYRLSLVFENEVYT